MHKVWEIHKTFDLLTWISLGFIYSLRTIYLPSLKFLGQSGLELWVSQGYGTRYRRSINYYDLWTTNLNIDKDHILMKYYLPTTLEVSGAKCSWVIGCTRLRETVILTHRHVQNNMPLLLQTFLTLLQFLARNMESLFISRHKHYDFNPTNIQRHSQWQCAKQTYM